MRRAILTASLVMLAAVTGCRKDDSSPTRPMTGAPEFPRPFQMSAPSSPNVPQTVVDAISQLNAYAAAGNPYFILARNVSPQKTDTSWLWTLDIFPLTASLIATQLGDTVRWEVRVTGNDGYHVYENWLAVEGLSAPGYQQWVSYAENRPDPIARIVVRHTASGETKATLHLPEKEITYQASMLDDSTAQISAYRKGNLHFKSQWRRAASGWAKFYRKQRLVASVSW